MAQWPPPRYASDSALAISIKMKKLAKRLNKYMLVLNKDFFVKKDNAANEEDCPVLEYYKYFLPLTFTHYFLLRSLFVTRRHDDEILNLNVSPTLLM